MAHDDGVPRTFHLDLTAPELRVVHAALRSFLGDFGHEEHDVQEEIRAVLRKLPEPETLESTA
jgi:hypothetical protein